MNWVKSHKLILVLLLIVAYLLFKDNISTLQYSKYNTLYSPAGINNVMMPSFGENQSGAIKPQAINDNNRMVIKESNLSLLVEDVRKTGDQIVLYAKSNGGYMVNSSYTRPDESPFANITVRIPAQKLENALSYFRSLSLKVTSENLVGTDVTQEYTDIDARLATLKKTQAKLEDILAKAISVQDILMVQRELINLQEQIDSLKGQQQSIEKNVQLTKISIYLSTDELSLPYTPDTVFRPDVIFKQAIRSLLNTVRIGTEGLIWIAIYSPLIALGILIYVIYKRFRQRHSKTN